MRHAKDYLLQMDQIMLTRLALTYICVITLFGCANLEDEKKALSLTLPTVTNFQSMQFKTLDTSTTEVLITGNSPTYIFEQGVSKYSAFKLPDDAEGKKLVIRALTPITNIFAEGKSWSPYFLPVVTFLDQSFKPIFISYEDRPNAYCEKSLCRGVVIQPAIPSNSKYFVIHTPMSKVGEFRYDDDTSSGLSYIADGSYVSIPGGANKRRSVAVSTGELLVRLQ